MSNPFGWLTPPGCGTNDTGPGGEELYKCDCCGESFEQGDIDPESDLMETLCRGCKAEQAEQEGAQKEESYGK